MYKGVAPDPNAKRKRTHPDQVPATQLEETSELIGPGLPDSRYWRPETRAWWDVWRSSPQAKVFLQTDWSSLIETAYLVDLLWDPEQGTSTQLRAAAEIRLRVAQQGATVADRLKLRMKSPKVINTAAERSDGITGSVASIADYRGRLGA